jgi:hypothetical protein
MFKVELNYILYTLSVVFLFRIVLYSLGEPHTDNPNPYSILFFIPAYLAINVLNKQNLLNEFKPHIDNINNLTIEQQKDLDLMIYQKGKRHFTWQMVCGMCGICTFFWVSLLFILIPNLTANGFFLFAFSNILNKIIIKWI